MISEKARKKFFVDLVRIEVQAGKGGDGMVHFRREKYVPRGGPDGGDGGRGGDVVLVGNPHLRTLLDYRYRRVVKAENGRPGGPGRRTGKKGKDVVLPVPLGTVVYDDDTGEYLGEITKPDDRLLVARGGKGGRGNARFATAENRAPRIAEKGELGERRRLRLELKLLGDVGIVGFPNAGKTTLLKSIAGVKAKVAPYPFTTLLPNLASVKLPDFEEFVMVDIPGIIEGAHAGRGMGLEFLRHIERCRLLLFVIDASVEDPERHYSLLKEELERYNPILLEKDRIVVLNKIDLLDEKQLRSLKFNVEDNVSLYKVSALTGEGVKDLFGGIQRWLKEKVRGTEEGKRTQ